MSQDIEKQKAEEAFFKVQQQIRAKRLEKLQREKEKAIRKMARYVALRAWFWKLKQLRFRFGTSGKIDRAAEALFVLSMIGTWLKLGPWFSLAYLAVHVYGYRIVFAEGTPESIQVTIHTAPVNIYRHFFANEKVPDPIKDIYLQLNENEQETMLERYHNELKEGKWGGI